MDFQPLISALPTLLGATIGAITSISTTMLSNWHNEKIERRKCADDHKRKTKEQQIDNCEKLLSIAQEQMSSNIFKLGTSTLPESLTQRYEPMKKRANYCD